jgi:hypothetical protein
MSKHPNAKKTRTSSNPPAKRYRGVAITLDGEPARLDMLRRGEATISVIGSTRRMVMNRDTAQAVVARGGAFVSPKFAQPKKVA